jgi:hypothetical protein
LNTPKAMSEIQPIIPPSIARPHGSVRLLPAASARNTKPDWMQEPNKKNKERKEKAAQEEKAAKEVEAVQEKAENEAGDENPDANGCCIMF